MQQTIAPQTPDAPAKTNIPPQDRLAPLPSRYCRAAQLLEILFDDGARPSLRWLREQQARRKIPSVTIGRLVFFDPPAVKAALDAQASRRVKGAA